MARAAAVCFDVGGTLLHMDPPPEVIFADLCRDLGVEIAPAAAARAYAHSERWFNAHRDLYTRAPEEFWRRGNRVLLERLGVRDELDARAAFITEEFSKRAGGWSVYPEVPQVLAALQARGLPLAVVSNWDPGLPGLLERLGLRAAFRVVIGSADAGVSKPDPQIFGLATAALGVAPAQTVHVGDLYEYDILGARAAGLIPVLLERGAERASVFSATMGRPYDGLRITDLHGLLPIVDGQVEAARGAR